MTTTYLTVSEAARRIRRKPYPVLQAIYRGELRAAQPGGEGAYLIRPADLEAYVQRSYGTTGGTLGERLARVQA